MKISVVMQSFLGDYPNSRCMPKEKFLRAVNSFLAQSHDDKELVIVSDGCDITKKMYELYYADKEEIKFCYLHRNVEKEKSMYNIEDNKIFYRGLPRQLGCEIATGDLITYFDSDDIMLSTRLKDIANFWKDLPEDVVWTSNPIRLMNVKAIESDEFKESKDRIGTIEIPIVNISTGEKEQFFINCMVKPGYISTATISICHRKNVKAKWKNVEMSIDNNGKKSGLSEDNDFAGQLLKEGKCMRQDSASIVVCHYKDLWDV